MKTNLLDKWEKDSRVASLLEQIQNADSKNIHVSGLSGSSVAFVIYSIFKKWSGAICIIQPDKESALHLFNDIEVLLDDNKKELTDKTVLFFPASYNNSFDFAKQDNVHALYRSTVLHRLNQPEHHCIVVCCPESFIEPVITGNAIANASLQLSIGDELTIDFLFEVFETYGFSCVDYVYEPGQFAVRGGIVDVFGFSFDRPFRIEFSGDEIASLRSFDAYTQASVSHYDTIKILSNLSRNEEQQLGSVFTAFHSDTLMWSIPLTECENLINEEFRKYADADYTDDDEPVLRFNEFLPTFSVIQELKSMNLIEQFSQGGEHISVDFGTQPHPHFAKNFDILFETLLLNKKQGISVCIFGDNPQQLKRLDMIIEDIEVRKNIDVYDNIAFFDFSIQSGFVDPILKIACFTDHQIFERYHRFRFTERHHTAEAMVLRDLQNIQPGDYVLHIDYGVGQYAGIEKIDVMGKEKEAIRIVYKNNDLLYVSIHALHKISRFTGKEGTIPTLDKIGSGAWQLKKAKAKSKVKDIARELIKLYAERRQAKGFAFLPDNYLQHELEASFIYEDTEDQFKATVDIKKDMEAVYPMDRLICGDVGFGKTEVAIRAAFKAVNVGKQVAVLVPTTILALQHYYTFTERLKHFPVRIEYLNRFRTGQEVKAILKDLEYGSIDIIIGTHKLLGKEIKFKDLGLFVIDEEQKFGVAAKEKIRQTKVNVDTLTLTATPIPRTLQFSLLGARDLSVINTPPPNRYPVHTELISFHTKRISEAIMYEVNRGGQVFFVNNKILNIKEVASVIRKICPGIRVEIGHGQMDGKELEHIVLDFIDGKFEVFVCTAIIESGIDIPNANTMIINDAQNFGLSDLHQLRGRVGRSNKKAFCYLISPPLVTLNEQSRKRLRAIIQLSDLGSGFQISMRDLDIRGAGNLLGGEQSGFISEIGYEMYQKILDEALLEIKMESENEVIDYSDPSSFIKECQIETDLHILIPDSYVSNMNERLILYKDIDNLETEAQAERYTAHLCDRFGPIPKETLELIEVVKLRHTARKAGIVKVVLKMNTLTTFFFQTDDEAFYASPVYNSLLNYVMQNHTRCSMKQTENKQLMILFFKISTVSEANSLLSSIIAEEVV